MRLITEISDYDKKRKKVYLDYEYAFLLYNSEIRKFALEVDSEIEEDLVQSIDELVNKRARARTLYILKSGQKTEKQLLDKLVNSGYTQAQASQAVEYAKSYRYVDDNYYASYFIDISKSNRSKKDIEVHLLQRGVPKEIIEDELEGIEIDEKGIIEELLRKKSLTPQMVSEMERKERDKIVAKLLRRGFSMSAIMSVIKGDFDF